MADNLDIVRTYFDRMGIPLGPKDVWEVQGTPVVKHRALERLAGVLHIQWRAPQVLIANEHHAVILATGMLPDGQAEEWSIGEAKVVPMVDSGRKNKWNKPIYEAADSAIGNYQITPRQAAYPFAMAEKRSKDRVILKLADLHGVYSEEEADDFKGGAEPQEDRPSDPPPREPTQAAAQKTNGAASDSIESKQARYAKDFITGIVKMTDVDKVRKVWSAELPAMRELGILGTPLEKELNAAWIAHGAALARAAGNPNATGATAH